MTLLSIAARRTPLLLSQRALPALTTTRHYYKNAILMKSTNTTTTPPPYDGHLTPDQMQVLDTMFGKMNSLETKMTELKEMVQDIQQTFGVDAPDGEVDGHVQEELQEVQHIIDEAAEHEDTAKINKEHKLEEDVKKFHARDPEHDW